MARKYIISDFFMNRFAPFFLPILICFTVKGQETVSVEKRNSIFIRMDYSITGDNSNARLEDVSFVYETGIADFFKQNSDCQENGQYRFEVLDATTGKIFYSHSFSDLFQEWQLTDEAHTRENTFRNSLRFVSSADSFIVKFFRRDSNLVFREFFSQTIFKSTVIADEVNKHNRFDSVVHDGGDLQHKLELVFVSEGYTAQQKSKFFSDAVRFKQVLFDWEPYASYKDRIRICAVFIESSEEGVDVPSENVWRKTNFNSSFGTFSIERYLSVPDMPAVYKALQGIYFDQLCIMVNSSRYGGGGIYNFYNLFTVDNEKSAFLFIHELGHSLAGLADEYYSSEVNFSEFVRLDLEPVEPNITTLANFDIKWKSFVSDTIPIPTPSLEKYHNVIGVFEGAAYQAKGVYRPSLQCAMKTSECTYFCEVCRKSIEQKLKCYSK